MLLLDVSRECIDFDDRGVRLQIEVDSGRKSAAGYGDPTEHLARLDDGLFDVILIGYITKRDFMTTAPKIYRGTYLAHPKVELLRSSAVAVDAPERLPIELDGEQVGTTPVRFEVVPGALRVRVPA